MKRNILVIALAAFVLCLTSCQHDPITTDTELQMTPKVTTTADLIGTDWTANITFEDMFSTMTGTSLEDIQLPEDLETTMSFHINFDAEYAHITFSDNIEMWQMMEVEGEYTMTQIEQMDLAYVYDGNTQTGTLTAVGVDENGEAYNYELPFTYDVVNDDININFNFVAGEEEETTFTFPLVFHRDVE